MKTPEEKAAISAYHAARRASRTPEQKAAMAAYHAAWRASRTPEQKAASAAYDAARRPLITPEQRAAKAAYAAARRALLTPEEKAAKAAYAAEWRALLTPEEKATMAAVTAARRASRTPEEKATIAAANRVSVAACEAAKPFNEVLFARIKKSCRESGRECTITASDLIVPEYCPVDGSKLERLAGPYADNLPSPDRIDSNEGYIPGNVRVISWRMNSLKSDATLAEIEALAEDAHRCFPVTNPAHL